MSHSSKEKKLNFSGPGTYRIDVRGRLEETWSDRLSGMRITHSTREGGSPLTTLMGPLRDQAELMGVLNSLYELHMPVVEVKYLGDQG